jgi:hypothetical protein
LVLIKTQCANITADDSHHFHYLFTFLCIRENETATNFFHHFTFGHTEAQGAGNSYTKHSLVNFALSLNNSKYGTVVQLYKLERDNGKPYMLEDLQ